MVVLSQMFIVAVLTLVDAQFHALLAAQDIGPVLRLQDIAIGIFGFAIGIVAYRAFGAKRLVGSENGPSPEQDSIMTRTAW